MTTTTSLPDVTLSPETLAFFDHQPNGLLIDNQWGPAADGQTFVTVNPADGRPLAEVALAGEADVDRAVGAARAAFRAGPWADLSGEARGELLWKLADLIEAHADELAEIETLDNGKPIRVSRRGDVPFAAKHFRYFAGWAGKLEGRTIPVSIPDKFVYTLRQPVGVVGLIIPWNFPILMAAWKLAPALACGNTVGSSSRPRRPP